MDVDISDENEQEVLCEKIINDIQAVFSKDHDLSSFEIIPTLHNCNKSPVVHIEHNLGVEAWCIKHVYDHAHKTIMNLRKHCPSQQRQRYLCQSDLLIKYLNVALLINPDVTSFWHIRRQLLQKNRIKINQEFQFAALILTKKPKSNEAFAYRRWLFMFQSSESIDWPAEIGICERSADRCTSNYHAWSHRQWVLQNAPFLMKSELMLSEKFVRKHISDYSSYHYRQRLIVKAYEICYYDFLELEHLFCLKKLIRDYLIDDINSQNDVLDILLPGADFKAVGEERLKSFLFCCNLAAHDMRMCEEQQNMYGKKECFELHRRASLKFIVEECVRLLLGELKGQHFVPPMTAMQRQAFHAQLRKFEYGSYAFLSALRHSEGLLGQTHRKWCNTFLGFDYSADD